MYKKILVGLDNSDADKTLLPHISKLALQLGSELLLVHVADGWVARNFNALELAESEEIKADRAYLQECVEVLKKQGLEVSAKLAMGDPPSEIMRIAKLQGCDLIALTAHGHRWLADLFFGSVINEVRHRSEIPVLVVRAGSSVAG